LSILSPPPADERDAEIEQKGAFFKGLALDVPEGAELCGKRRSHTV
jgi:hypothetical protein